MKLIRILILAAFILPVLSISAVLADETAKPIPTAQELYALDPDPQVPMHSDPYIDPLLYLVNKENPLPYDYIPVLTELDLPHKPGIDTQSMIPEAAEALRRLFAAADQDGIELGIVSGYRSYSTQKAIHNKKVAQKGRATAELTSAPPGKSEHQLGQAVDISSKSINYRLNAIFANTEEGKWLYDHCAEYGFIIRYKKEWQSVTGYKTEPWHLRYVGREHATLITKLDVPYEIYMQYLKLCWDARDHHIAGDKTES